MLIIVEFKRTLVTAALPYVNNVPHLGNIICTLRADIYSRYLKLNGKDTIFICGTDESGTRTEIEAKHRGITPDKYCKQMHNDILTNFKWLGIEFDAFGRTSSDTNKMLTQEIFNDLDKKGLILEKELTLLYCKHDNMYLPDSYVEGTCPHCGFEGAKGDQCDNCSKFLEPIELKNPKCKLCGKVPEVRKDMHLFLDLPKIAPALKKWIESKDDWKGVIRNMPLAWIKEGLEPRCISRNLNWGTKIPKAGYEDKVFYVWFDAPVGYIAFTCDLLPKDWKTWWQSKDTRIIHFLGKDNVPFHTIIWPSELMSNNKWTLPDYVASNEYLNYQGQQFSKSRNLGIFTSDLSKIDIEPSIWRFYLSVILPEHKDYDFSWQDLMDKTNNELVANIGNFLFRTLSFSGKHLGVVPECALNPDDIKIIDKVEKLKEKYAEKMEIFELKEALKTVLELSNLANQYFQKNEPWVLVKTDKVRCGTVLNVCLNMCSSIARLLYPFVPVASRGLWKQLGYKDDVGKSGRGVVLKVGQKLGTPEILFKKIEKEDTAKYEVLFSGKDVKEVKAGKDVKVDKDAKGSKDLKDSKVSKGSKKSDKDDGDSMVTYEVFSKFKFKVGTVVDVKDHPEADKLYVLSVDLGTEVRQIVAGMKAYYKPSELKGKQIIVVSNLKPAMLRGIESQGMVLAAEKGKDVVLLSVDKMIKNGANVC
ncbi:MAG: methionine--tRNA ligase [DPANN group archaeon]|nr:methionine--tRNA ligase [DPANN group archaeon]